MIDCLTDFSVLYNGVEKTFDFNVSRYNDDLCGVHGLLNLETPYT